METWGRWSKGAGLGCLGMAAALPVLAGGEGLWVDGYVADDCVLQREAVIRIGGGATPGKRVEVVFRGAVVGTESKADGRWEVSCGPYEAGGPDTMEILSGGERIRVERVLVGDVWIFLGQSNMAYTMAPYLPWTEGVPEYEEAIASVEGRNISLMTQPRFVHHEPWDRVEGAWLAASPRSVRHYSAVAWYTLMAMREKSAIPLGGIVAAIGSTGLVLLESSDDGWHLWFADPTQQLRGPILLHLNGLPYHAELPAGAHAGSSVELKAIRLDFEPGPPLRLQFERPRASAGLAYRIESRALLPDSPWTEVTGITASSSDADSWESVTLELNPSPTAHLYRLRISPQ